MENLFKKAISLTPENGILTEADTFLALAVAHNVFKVKILEKQKKQNDEILASLFNEFCEVGLLGEKQENIVSEILNAIADKNGLERPKFQVMTNSIFSGQLAAANANNSVRIYKKKLLETHKFYGQSFGQILKSLAHESQHLKQFFFIKQFLTGNNDVDIKYKIMAFQQIFQFCGIRTSKLDFLANEKYWYNAMEIDARQSGAQFILDAINNKQISKNAKKQLVYFASNQLESSANMYDSGKKLLKQLAWQEKKFKKDFGDCPLAQILLKEFNILKPQMFHYAKELDFLGYELSKNILILKQENKLMQKQTKAFSFEEK